MCGRRRLRIGDCAGLGGVSLPATSALRGQSKVILSYHHIPVPTGHTAESATSQSVEGNTGNLQALAIVRVYVFISVCVPSGLCVCVPVQPRAGLFPARDPQQDLSGWPDGDVFPTGTRSRGTSAPTPDTDFCMDNPYHWQHSPAGADVKQRRASMPTVFTLPPVTVTVGGSMSPRADVSGRGQRTGDTIGAGKQRNQRVHWNPTTWRAPGGTGAQAQPVVLFNPLHPRPRAISDQSGTQSVGITATSSRQEAVGLPGSIPVFPADAV